MNKKTISVLLTLFILIGTIFSFASCMRLIGIIGSSTGEQSGGGNSGGQHGTQGGEAGNAGGDGAGENDKPVDFYPGSSDINTDSASASARTLLTSVSIASHFEKYGISFGYDEPPILPYDQYGSGVFYSVDKEKGDAYVLTNFHVAYHNEAVSKNRISTDIDVFLYGQESEEYAIPATFVGGSMTYDIAILKITDSEVIRNSLAIPVTAADSDLINVMDPIIAIGNSEGYGISVTNGIVSVDNEELEITAADGHTNLIMRVMRISAAINQGNSGGGVFTTDGRLAGIVVAKREGSDVDNVAYCIPANLAMNVADNIMHYCNNSQNSAVYECTLGITVAGDVKGLIIDDETGKVHKAELVSVESVSADSIIYDSIKVGDIINSISIGTDTKSITRVHHLLDFMITARVGDTVTLNVTRGDDTLDITVTFTNDSLVTIK